MGSGSRFINETAAGLAGGRCFKDGENGTGIVVGGWAITTFHGTIAPQQDREAFETALGVSHIPEQIYACNRLVIKHLESGLAITFCALDALKQWRDDKNAPVRLDISEAWRRDRIEEMKRQNAEILEYDWTFSTSYGGTCSFDEKLSCVGSPGWVPTSQQMDMAMLTSRDDILLFDSLPLYVSELDDNGVSEVSVKIRVMPRCWYVLLRFFLRVDGQMVKIRDHRYFCKFEESKQNRISTDDGSDGVTSSDNSKLMAKIPRVLRETRYQEGTNETLLKAGAPGLSGSAYIDADSSAIALQAVAPIGVTRFEIQEISLMQK
eukprot:jgi/Picsp_1/2131/NSC_05596-R1_protein